MIKFNEIPVLVFSVWLMTSSRTLEPIRTCDGVLRAEADLSNVYMPSKQESKKATTTLLLPKRFVGTVTRDRALTMQSRLNSLTPLSF